MIMTAVARERIRVFVLIASVAGPAWILLALGSAELASPAICSSELLWAVPTPETYAFFFAYVSPLSLVHSWAFMIAAMMLPTHADALGHVGARSFKRTRPWLELLVTGGYLGVWMLSGVVFLGILLTVRLASPLGYWPMILSLVAAFVWQVSSLKQFALNKCHRRPAIAAFAPAAYREALFLGITNGLWCIVSCWALMLVSLLAPTHHIAIMAIVALYIWAERLEPPRAPEWQVRVPHKALRLVALLVSGSRSR